MIKCQICGKKYSERGLTYHITHIHNISKKDYYDTYKKQPNEGFCKHCGKPTKFLGNRYAEYCSNKCTCLDRYGVENNLLIPEVKQKAHTKEAHKKAASKHNYTELLEKGKQTRLERYNDRNFNNSKKSRRTKKERYGDENYNNRDKAKTTCLEKYGTENPMQSIGKQSVKQTNLKRYGVQSQFQLESTREKSKQTKLSRYDDVNYNNRDKAKQTCLNRYGVDNPIKDKSIQKKALSHTCSKAEDLLEEFIRTFYDGEILRNQTGIIGKFELDLYLPDIQLAIEYNGIRYHSIEMGKPKDRILRKSIACRNKGIRLIHIYEFEDFDVQKQLLKDLILGKDCYGKRDFNKNNFLDIPEPEIVYKDDNYTVYGAGKLRTY